MSGICIIGGGASGMVAAITAKQNAPLEPVMILEKMKEPGRKLKATGNGRCNLSNEACPDAPETMEFFRSLGLLTRSDEAGRLYPYSEDGEDVIEALTAKLKELGVKVLCHAEVTAVTKTEDGFQISWNGGRMMADQLLIATGGKAGPKFGSTGDGYKLAKSLGHSVTRLAPALTAIETRENLRGLSGIREKCVVRLLLESGTEHSQNPERSQNMEHSQNPEHSQSGEPSQKPAEQVLSEEKGEVQFTDYGISGICVFNLSGLLTIPEGKDLSNGFDDYRISIDFLPEIEDAEGLLQERLAEGIPTQRVLHSLVKKPIAREIRKRAGDDMERMARELKDFRVRPEGLRGWQYAQVTKGGVPYEEIDQDTMESKCCPGLYLAGEILDYDGPCGGYNLQHAWSTGILAGRGLTR